jgi:hypothetical protein
VIPDRLKILCAKLWFCPTSTFASIPDLSFKMATDGTAARIQELKAKIGKMLLP